MKVVFDEMVFGLIKYMNTVLLKTTFIYITCKLYVHDEKFVFDNMGAIVLKRCLAFELGWGGGL